MFSIIYGRQWSFCFGLQLDGSRNDLKQSTQPLSSRCDLDSTEVKHFFLKRTGSVRHLSKDKQLMMRSSVKLNNNNMIIIILRLPQDNIKDQKVQLFFHRGDKR